MKGGFSKGKFTVECEGFKTPDGVVLDDFWVSWIDFGNQNIILESNLLPI